MLKPNPVVVKELKKYCKDLFVNWNNENLNWEVWITMPWGNRLITPVVKSIYEDGADMKYCPLDLRIMRWIYQADSQRKDISRNWKWLGKLKHKENNRKRREERYKNHRNLAKETWSLVNNEFIGMSPDADEDFNVPDIKTNDRIMYRSKENAKLVFGEDHDIN